MAACNSAGTWPPPSPGLETWRAGTKMAAPPNFHCYFGHSSSYFLGTQLPPCDGGSGGNGTGTRLRHGGGRAEGERESEGREGSASRGWGRKPSRGEVGREEVRGGGEGGEAREPAGAPGRRRRDGERRRGRRGGVRRGRGLGAGCAGREDFRGRNLPAPLQCVGPRRRPGGGSDGRWVAAEAAG